MSTVDHHDTPTRKAYEGADVTISFDSALCQHAAECVKVLPTVFDTGAAALDRSGRRSGRRRDRGRRPVPVRGAAHLAQRRLALG